MLGLPSSPSEGTLEQELCARLPQRWRGQRSLRAGSADGG
jgi:hypothetical protein